MAPAYSNAFDLLGDDDTVDVKVLYDRLKQMIVEEVPSSPTNNTTIKGVTVFVENKLVQDVSNVAENGTASENGWQQIVRRKRRVQADDNVNVNGSEQVKEEEQVDGEKPKRKGRGRGRGNKRFGGNNSRYKGNGTISFEQSSNNANVDQNDHSEVNGEEAGENKSTDETEKNTSDNVDIPARVETPEEEKLRKEKEARRKKQLEEDELWRKEKEERKKKREEEAKKKTLLQYEQIILEKQQKLPKAEAKRVVALDKELENMKLVSKKQDDNVVMKGSKLKKGESQVKKSSNLVAVDLAKLFRPPSFQESNRAFIKNDGQQRKNGRPSTVTHVPLTPAAEIPTSETDVPDSKSDLPTEETENASLIYDTLFPVLGFVPSEPCEGALEPSKLAANPTI